MKEEHAVRRELKVEMTKAFLTAQNCSSSLQNPSSRDTSLKLELLKLSGTMEIQKHCDHSSEKRNHLFESVKGTSVENDGNCGLVERLPVASKILSDEKTSALVHCYYNDTMNIFLPNCFPQRRELVNQFPQFEDGVDGAFASKEHLVLDSLYPTEKTKEEITASRGA